MDPDDMVTLWMSVDELKLEIVELRHAIQNLTAELISR